MTDESPQTISGHAIDLTKLNDRGEPGNSRAPDFIERGAEHIELIRPSAASTARGRGCDNVASRS